MGWSLGWDPTWDRDIGYGVPALCDHPKCTAAIDRGLGNVCGGRPYGEPHGCGLFFCGAHLHLCFRRDESAFLCPRCMRYKPPYKRPKADVSEWLRHTLRDGSWNEWRLEHPGDVARIRATLRERATMAKRLTGLNRHWEPGMDLLALMNMPDRQLMALHFTSCRT